MEMRFFKIQALALATWIACTLGGAQALAEKHMTIGLWAFPSSAGNPFSGTTVPAILTIPAIFDGLTRITRSGDVLPALALSWEQEEDTVWIFKLRPDVKFSNGEPFNAAAVIAAFEFLQSDQGSTAAAAREVSDVTSVLARDEHTVEFVTAAPSPLATPTA